MKSLQESLFDKDLTQQKLALFGEYYKPVSIKVDHQFMKVLNVFALTKLKKDIKPIDISDVKIEHICKLTQQQEAQIKDVFKYILAIIAALPYKEEIKIKPNNEQVYWNEIREALKPYIREGKLYSASGANAFWPELELGTISGRVRFGLYKKLGMRGLVYISVYYEEK